MPKVVIGASRQTSRAEGTADIHIKTGFEEEGAEFTDIDRLSHRCGEDQSICTWDRVHSIGKNNE